MAVNDRDPAWAVQTDNRAKVADLFSGRDTALSYIRALPGHDETTAKAFRSGAYFLPVVARTAEAFGGLVFAKTPTRNVPSGLDTYLKDVTGSGQDMDRLAEQAFDAILQTGAVMVLVDYPSSDERLTVAQAEQRGLRPVLRLYDANAILAARLVQLGAARRPGQIRVREVIEVEGDDFTLTAVEQIRVLELVKGKYQQQVWRAEQGKWKPVETVTPRKNNAPLTEIPAYFCNPRDGEPSPAKPPLADLAEISIAHLNNSAALEWALLWTANPTPVFKGLNIAEGETVKLGSSEGIAVSAEGDAKFMEFTGSGLSELRLALEAKRKDAALMGARMLLESNKQAIAAETARIERAGETSVVAGIANALSDCLTKALAFMADWAGIGGEVEYWLNTDVNPAGLSAQELTALLAAWQSGAITLEDLFENLQRAEIVDPAKSFDDHREQLAEEGEALGVIEDDEAA